MQGWGVVMTKPNCENIAQDNLLKQGYGCYFPCFQALQGVRLVKRPLFPRYIFAFIDKFWYSIRGTRGVSHILMGDNGPASIPQTVIDSLRAREDGNGFIVLGKTKPLPERFSKGDLIRAVEGPLVGFDLIYEGMKDVERVKVLTTLLGRQVSVVIEDRVLVVS